MHIFNQIKTIFSFFLTTTLKSRRTKTFFFISLIPSIIIIIVNIAGKGDINPEFNNLFQKIGIIFFFGFFIQILALFYGTSIINDEVNDKTLIYLTTKPISKSSILLGKYLANFVISLLIMVIGLAISYIAALKGHTFDPFEILATFGIAAITILLYMALFTLFGTTLKRPIMIGLMYIFGWELILTPLIGGTLQKFSFAFYLNKLLPGNIFEYKSYPSSVSLSLIVLFISSIIFMAISIFAFKKKEYNMSDAS